MSQGLRPVRVVGDLSGLPGVRFGPRSLIWWGSFGFMLLEGSGFLLAAGVYLYLASRGSTWPPAGDRLPDLFWSGLFTLALLASQAPNLWVRRKAHEKDAKAAARELASALRLLQDPSAAWRTPVLTCSAQQGTGLDQVWETIQRHRTVLESTGELDRRRRDQQVSWTWNLVSEQLLTRLHNHPQVRAIAPELEQQVRDGSVTATSAADQILKAFGVPDA